MFRIVHGPIAFVVLDSKDAVCYTVNGTCDENMNGAKSTGYVHLVKSRLPVHSIVCSCDKEQATR